MGLLSGTIIAKTLPQFLKRCCTLSQLVWIHAQIIERAEGELWVELSRLSKVFNWNQNTRRLTEAIRQAAAHQKWTDAMLEAMLKVVKSIAYNKAMHTLHFYFFTKQEALLYEGMLIPFRKSKLVLKNPDTKLGRSANADGLPTDDEDGLVNDRYQAHYKIRLINVPRTLDLSAVMAYLQQVTENGLKSGVPLDTYGPFAEGSVMWDLFGCSATCPTQLLDVHRLDWDGHHILLQHRPDSGPQPCLQCARVGHQTAGCITPEAEWNDTTLVVTAAEIAKLTKPAVRWKNMEDVKAIFTSLKSTSPTADQSSTGTTAGATPPAEQPAPDSSSGEVPVNGSGVSDVAQVNGLPDDGNAILADDAHSTNQSNPEPREPGWSQQGRKSKNAPRGTTSSKTQKNAKNNQSQKHKKPHPNLPSQNPKHPHRPHGKAGTNPTPSNPYAALSGSDDEDASEDDDDAHGGPRPAPGFKNADYDANDSDDDDVHDEASEARLPLPKPKPPVKPTPSDLTDDDLVNQAIHRARLEQIRTALLSQTKEGAARFDPDLLRAAIARARPHINVKSSKAWILEAINGRLADTPGTGNCQFYAAIEALLQLDLKKADDKTPLIDATMLYKYGLLEAHKHVSTADIWNNNAAAILDIPAGTLATMSEEQQKDLVTKFYNDLACSSSDYSSTLPRRLWGHFDSLRMGASLLGRPIFLVSERNDPLNCFLNIIRLQTSKTGEIFAAITQPGVEAWFTELEAEDQDQAQTQDPKTPSNRRDTSSTARSQVLASSVKLTETDLISFLSDSGWTTAEKAEIVSILVAGATNFRELLTFSAQPSSSSSTEPSQPTPNDADSESSDYEPSDNEMESTTGASQPYSLPEQGSAEYRAWADEIWEPVVEDWLVQHNEKLPHLHDSAGLRKFMQRSPGLLLDAGRWSSNPFVLLDHFQPDEIRQWMAPYWLEYCVAQLTPRVSQVSNQQIRGALEDWLDSLRAAPTTDVGLTLFRNEQAWKMIKDFLPTISSGATAVPLLKPRYQTVYAFIMALDQLFPALAGYVLQEAGQDYGATAPTLMEAYRPKSRLAKVLRTAMDADSWNPVAQYMNSLETSYDDATASRN